MNRTTKLSILAGLIPVLILSVGSAYAGTYSIDGTVKSGGSGIDDAKVTAERVGDYESKRTNGVGYFDLNTSAGSTYTVESMKSAYTRDSDNLANPGTSMSDQTISSRSYETVDFKVAYDTDTSITHPAAKFLLLTGEPWFDEEHSIIFNETVDDEDWSTSDESTTDVCVLLIDMVEDLDWPDTNPEGADMLFGYSAYNVGAGNSQACMVGSDEFDDHPAVIVLSGSSDYARSVMHEISHAYDIGHDESACNTLIPGIMSVGPGPSACSEYIKNWIPDNDDTMETDRDRW